MVSVMEDRRMLKVTMAAMALIVSASAIAIAAVPVIDNIEPAQIGVQDFAEEAKRRKPRVPGGSGCDSPTDLIEHADCRD
jgi:hypothetical protein